MFKRIEELEDLLIEQKQKSGVSKIIELETSINHLNLEIGWKSQLIEDLNEWLKLNQKKETLYLDESEAINFFSELVKEKDLTIKKLQQRIDTLSTLEQEKETERAKLAQLVERRTEEFDDLKSKRVRFTEMMREWDLRPVVPDQRSKWFEEESEMK